jgi:lysophospholipase L1-like esterase
MTAVVLVALVLAIVVTAIEVTLRAADVADPPIFLADPRFGYLMQPNQSVSTRGHRFRINNLGLRGDNLGPKVGPELRVLFVGDSVTYGGGGVADPDLFVTRIADRVSRDVRRPVIAINASAPGWGIQNMSGFITAVGLLQADAVVWVVPSADFRRQMTTLSDFGFPESRPRSRTAYLASTWLRAARKRVKSRRPLPRADMTSENLAVFDAALAAVRAAAVPSIVVVLPRESGYGQLRPQVARFKAVAEAHGATFCDLEACFLRTPRDSALFHDAVHLAREGHRVFAEAVAPLVTSASKVFA